MIVWRVLWITLGMSALVFTMGVTLGLWTVGDFPPSWTFLMGYGARALVSRASGFLADDAAPPPAERE